MEADGIFAVEDVHVDAEIPPLAENIENLLVTETQQWVRAVLLPQRNLIGEGGRDPGREAVGHPAFFLHAERRA